MNASELIKILQDRIEENGGDLPVQLMDIRDDSEDSSYPIDPEFIEVLNCTKANDEGGEEFPVICIEFANNHLEKLSHED